MEKIYNIPGNHHFLKSLTYFILSNYKLSELSKLTLLLPSRRSVRLIKKYFLEQSQESAIILPRIKAIGDIDYDELLIDYISKESIDANFLIKPSSKLKYKILLTKEIEKWNRKSNLFGKDVSLSHIFSLAINLESFLSEVEKENLSLDNLSNIDDSEISDHKRKILSFLRYFGSEWKNILLKNNISSIVNYQNQMINFYSDFLNRNRDREVIIAGSTGSVVATANLTGVILKLPKGRVFLQNLDQNIDFKIPEYHPQFLLSKLLQKINFNKKDIKNLEFSKFYLQNNSVNLLHHAMLPAEELGNWQISNLDQNNIQNLTRIEARDIYEEIDLISLIVREQIELNQEVAIISSDSNFSNILSKKLEKWGININDSANNYLQNSEIVNFLLLIFRFFNEDFSTINLISILKHPLVRCGFDDQFYRTNLSCFEVKILRQNIRFNDLEEILKFIDKVNNPNLSFFFNKILNIFQEFFKPNSKSRIDLIKIIDNNLKISQNLTTNNSDYVQIVNFEGFAEFSEFYRELKSLNLNFEIGMGDYIKILNLLVSGKKFKKEGAKYHPKLHIFSNIEARLVNPDVLIIPNLNEGDFPNFNNFDNWLNSKMREELGMSSNLRKIAVSAFDFCNYLQNKKVFLTRSYLKDNSPTEKSRFLLKLETVLKANNLEKYLDAGIKYKNWLNLINNNQKIEELPKINTNIDISNRKFNFSVTDVSKWLRNPYYIYSKRILKLKKLNEIEGDLLNIEFGNFVHKVLERYIKKEKVVTKNSNIDDLILIADDTFLEYFKNPEDKLIWWPKFLDIADYFFQKELEISNDVLQNFSEIEVNLKIKDILIKTKIDRIIVKKSGEIIVIDYKTGLPPTKKDVALGREPQLSLESVILALGKVINSGNYFDYRSIDNISFDQISNLQYIKLSSSGNSDIIDNNKSLDQILSDTENGLVNLIEYYCYNQNEFIINSDDQSKLDDYHLLARINV